MIILVAIYDKKAAEYQAPLAFDNLTSCLRAFARLPTENPKMNLVQFSEDFDLYEIGQWDAVSGEISPVIPAHFLEHVSILIQPKREVKNAT